MQEKRRAGRVFGFKKEPSMGSMFKNIDEELYDGILWILSNSCEDYQKKYCWGIDIMKRYQRLE